MANQPGLEQKSGLEQRSGLLQRAWFLPLSASAVWWLVRLSLLGRVPFETGIIVGSLLHFGLMIAMVFIHDVQSNRGLDFIQGFKSNLRPAVLLACFGAASVGFLHHGVTAEATSLRKLERERFIEQSLSSDEAFALLQESDPQLAYMDRETARQRALDGLRFQFEPMWHVTASLLALLAAALSTTLFVTFVGRVLRA